MVKTEDEVGSLDDFGYLIEEEMGKVALDGVSSCLVPHSGDADRGEGSCGGRVVVNGNGMKRDGIGGSVVGNTVGSNDHPASKIKIEEETSSSSQTSSSSDDDDDDDKKEEDDRRDEKGKCGTWLRGGGSSEKGNFEGEVEIEEGEIMASEAEEMVAWSGDEDDEVGGNVSGEPLRSKNELRDLPPVPPVDVTLQPHHQTLPVGVVLSILGAQVIVEGVEKHNPLNEGSILWITQSRCPLGIVDEIFGPVKNPYYIIRYNSESEVPSGLQPGDSICFVAEFANHILNDKSLYEKAYDASGANDEELVEEEDFSDDEKEAEFRKMLKMKKRGSNHENAENKNMERRVLKNKSGNRKHDHAPVRQNPGLSVPSAKANEIPFQPPQNMGVAGFPNNNSPWLGQVNPQMLYQMNMQNGLRLQQQFGMTTNFPPNPVFQTVQPGFGATPAFAHWPAGLGQNMLNPLVFPMVAPGQQFPFHFNAGQQAFPFNMQQIGHNSSIMTDLATSGKPETFGSSSQGSGQNLSNPSQFGMAASGQQQNQAFPSNTQQMGFGMAASGQQQNQAFPSNTQQMGFGMAASSQQQNQAFPSGTQQMGFGMAAPRQQQNQAFSVDDKGMRWFYTGDIGRVHPDGCLEIIDRKKDIVKLQHGEYISLGKIEAALVASSYIDTIMVYADPLHNFCVALVVPSRPVLEKWAQEGGIEYADFADLCEKAEAISEVQKSVSKVGKEAKLDKFELPAKVKLLPEPWTPESGLVTAALKLKREQLKAKFKDELDKLYA